ncbi:TPA: hypothetical protein NGQ73_004625 [Vibrio parahaemolyticus]|nr:hypothetical protein [Vibrio parahaemolyticus]
MIDQDRKRKLCIDKVKMIQDKLRQDIISGEEDKVSKLMISLDKEQKEQKELENEYLS